MYMTEQQRLADARVLASTWDKLVRNPKRITPTAPWIIPATMIFVGCFAIICLVIKLFINYLGSKSGGKTKKYGLSETSSPELPLTPTEDQASMATTASMKTRDGSSRLGSKRARPANRPPAVSLYQIKQMQSPASTSSPTSAAAAVAAVAAATSKSKHSKAAMKALAKAAKSEANKSRSSNRASAEDNDNNSDDNNSHCDLDQTPSHHSGDSDLQEAGASAVIFGGNSRMHNIDEPDKSLGGGLRSSHEPEVHIVQIRDIEDNLQHPQPSWQQAESEI